MAGTTGTHPASEGLHQMKIETYIKVLAGWWRQGTWRSVYKWQVDDSAWLMISEGTGQVLSPLRPITAKPYSAAIWYHAIGHLILNYATSTCHTWNLHFNQPCRR